MTQAKFNPTWHMSEEEFDEIMSLLDWIDTTCEGTPVRPLFEISRRCREQMMKMNYRYRKRRDEKE